MGALGISALVLVVVLTIRRLARKLAHKAVGKKRR